MIVSSLSFKQKRYEKRQEIFCLHIKYEDNNWILTIDNKLDYLYISNKNK